MNYLNLLFCLVIASSFPFMGADSSSNFDLAVAHNSELYSTNSVSETYCSSSFGGNVKTYAIKSGYSEVGNSIWISRKSGEVKAKYFAHRWNDNNVHHRYAMWRRDGGVNVVLKSSGAYATGWDSSSLPVGVTVDNGNVVNNKYDSRLGGLVIVYATGGIAISNIKDGDLYLDSEDGTVDVRDEDDRAAFLDWAQEQSATVFQTHLMVYKNEIKVGKYNSSDEEAKRKFLILAKSDDGELFHVIMYLKKDYTLYDATKLVRDYLVESRGFDLIAMVNLDTGGYDILNTAGDAEDCEGSNVWGTSTNYEDMTNLLAYEYEEL